MKFLRLTLPIFMLLSAKGASLSINFVGSNEDTDAIPQGQSAGASGYDTATWINIHSSSYSGNVIDSDGQSIPFSFSSGSLNALSISEDNGDSRLMSGFLYSDSTIKINFGIPSSYRASGFDVVVYFNSNFNGNIKLVLQGDSRQFYSAYTQPFSGDYVLADSLDPSSPTYGANYAVFTNVNYTPTVGIVKSQGASYTYISGIQIVQVPEPTCLSLILFSLVLFMYTRKKRTRRCS